MKVFIKCEICDVMVPTNKCTLSMSKRIIDGKEHFFCCERCADEFEKK